MRATFPTTTLESAKRWKIADGLGLSVSDLDGDGHVSHAEFETGPEIWFNARNKNGGGVLTLEDPAR